MSDDTRPESSTAASGAGPLDPKAIESAAIEAVKTVFDPEIPVNIYELGLIYGIDVADDGTVAVRMTLTAPACPAAEIIPVDVETKIRAVAGVKDVSVEIVWDPPWSPDKMSEIAKLELGMM
jgi:FeS assembly SUF system protein